MSLTKNSQHTQSQRILISFTGSLCSRLLGFTRDSLIAYVLGASADIFLVAYRIPNTVRRLMAEGTLGMSHTAILAKFFYMEETSQSTTHLSCEKKTCFQGLVFSFQVFLRVVFWASLFALFLILFAHALISFFAPGFSAESLQNASHYLQLCSPYIPLATGSAIVAATLNAAGRFVATAFASCILNIGIIVSLLPFLLSAHSLFSLQDPALWICFGVVGGAFLQLLFLLFDVYRLYSKNTQRLHITTQNECKQSKVNNTMQEPLKQTNMLSHTAQIFSSPTSSSNQESIPTCNQEDRAIITDTRNQEDKITTKTLNQDGVVITEAYDQGGATTTEVCNQEDGATTTDTCRQDGATVAGTYDQDKTAATRVCNQGDATATKACNQEDKSAAKTLNQDGVVITEAYDQGGATTTGVCNQGDTTATKACKEDTVATIEAYKEEATTTIDTCKQDKARPRPNDVIKTMPWSILGGASQQINMIIAYVAASFFSSGSITALFFAERLMELPLTLAGATIATVALPNLAVLLQKKQSEAFQQELGKTLLSALFLILPASMGLAGVALPCVTILFGHGNFDQHAVEVTATGLRIFCLGLPGMCMARILTTALTTIELSSQKQSTLCAVAFFISAIVTACACLFFTKFYALYGVFISISLGAWTQALLLLVFLHQQGYAPKVSYKAIQRVIGYVFLAFGMFCLLSLFPFSYGNKTLLALYLVSCVSGFSILWLVLLRLLGCEEALYFLNKTLFKQ